MANYHVVPNHDGGWDVKPEGADKASKHFEMQEEAVDSAKMLCGNSGGGEVRIHNLDGTIRDSDTVPPGHDPFPPKDNVF